MTSSLRLHAILKAISPSSPTVATSSAQQHITTMSTSSAQSTTAAPWRARFLSDIKQMDQPAFTFASLHSSPSGAVPRGRTCIYRGLWAQLPPNDKNNAPRNPEGIYESDLPVLTTDARMDKVPDIFAPADTTTTTTTTGSGGGGPVEAMWWAVSTQTQWRIRGRAWVLAPGDVGGAGAGAKAVRAALGARMRKMGGEAGEWDWERELVGHFGNLSPGMRGSFKNPSPGTPRANEPGEGEGLGQKVGDELLEDQLARRNFRVVVIEPDEVDLVDLSDPADQRRYLYTYVGAGAKATKAGAVIEGEWEKVELWP